MAEGMGNRVRRVVGGVSLVGCLLGAFEPALAETPETPDESTTTTAPPIETKILLIEPAPRAEPPPEPPPEPPTTTTTTTMPAVTTPAGTPDAAALRALVEAAAVERRRLRTEIGVLEALVADAEAALAAAQGQVTDGQAQVEALEARVAQTALDLERAGHRIAQMDRSAAAAADAVAANRTPVARPPARGHTPQDAAAQARRDVVAAREERVELTQALVDLQGELDVARLSASGASAETSAKSEELQRARDALAQLQEQLIASERAATEDAARLSGPVTLDPAPSALATATVPAGYLSLYGRAAASCHGLPWAVIAAVGSVESAHGQSSAPGVHSGENYAGAMGPMQFLAGTWAAYGVDGDGDGTRDVYNATDAVFGAANYLCASGAGEVTTLRRALWNYNHADWYVDLVLELAARYTAGAGDA